MKSPSFIRQPKFARVDPEADMYRENLRAESKTVKPRGQIVFNKNGTLEEKCAWMRAKQAGLIRPGRKKGK
jgi:hypothetical protein